MAVFDPEYKHTGLDRIGNIEQYLVNANGGSQTALEQSFGYRGGILLPFWAGLAARGASPVDILVLGDSKAEGHGASVVGNRWIDKLLGGLRTLYQPAGVTGGQGYVPAWYGSTFTGTNPPTVHFAYSGSVTATSQQAGLGRRSASFNATGASASLTFTGTSLKLFFTKMNAAANSVTIQIDGGTVFTYTDPRTSGNPTISGGVWNSVTNGPGALSAASHTVVISWASGQTFLEGAMIFNGDESSGVRLWDGSHFGYLCNDLISSGHTAWQGVIPLINPALTIIAFGTNEYRTGGRTAAQFNSDLTTLIANVRTQYAKTGFVLLMDDEPSAAGATPVDTYANYVAQAYTVAQADTSGPYGQQGIAVLDMTKRMLIGSTDTYAMHTDGIHWNDVGDLYVADVVGGFLRPA